MTKRSKGTSVKAPDHHEAKAIEQTSSEAPADTPAERLARGILQPYLRHGATAFAYTDKLVTAPGVPQPDAMDYSKYIRELAKQAEDGDVGMASRMLASQAVTLDTMFTEFARRAALNMGEYIGAAERYGRIALKAQSHSRAALEALTKLHHPHEQTVRHVHVNEGGQAVVADQIHHHGRGAEK